jgi:hypothetical protein
MLLLCAASNPSPVLSVLSVSGGDFGEFLLALAEYETLTKRSFTSVEVQKILVAWLDWAPRGSRPLTLQTDEAALLHLQQNLHFNGVKGKVVALDIENPKPEYQTELLKDLPNSKNMVTSHSGSFVDVCAAPLRLCSSLVACRFTC